MKFRRHQSTITALLIVLSGCDGSTATAIEDLSGQEPLRSYVIGDRGQEDCFSDTGPMACPSAGSAFSGQDAQYAGVQASYQDNGDGTVTDLNTGLVWQKTPDLDHQATFAEAVAGAAGLTLGGYDDWRLPSVKELYSLMDFNGNSASWDPVPYLGACPESGKVSHA